MALRTARSEGVDKHVVRDSHIERTHKGASEQILLVTSISPTLDVAHTGTIILLLNEELLVHLPSLSSDSSGKRVFGVAWNDVDGGLTIVGRFGRRPPDGSVCGKMGDGENAETSRYDRTSTHGSVEHLEMGRTC